MVIFMNSVVAEKDIAYIYQKASRIPVVSQNWKSIW